MTAMKLESKVMVKYIQNRQTAHNTILLVLLTEVQLVPILPLSERSSLKYILNQAVWVKGQGQNN